MSFAQTFGLPENIFQVLFEKSPGSLVLKANAPTFTVLGASDNFLTISSKTRENIIGKRFFEAFAEIGEDNDSEANAIKLFGTVIETGQKIDVPNYRFNIYNPQTKKYDESFWSVNNIPIFDAENHVAFILITVIDITSEVVAKKAAEESESRLRLATDAAAIAIWDLNLKDQNFIYSPRLAEIFGHAPGTNVALADIRKQVNAGDMENIVLKAFNESLITGNYLYEVRIIWPDGSLHWIRVQGKVIKDEKKQPVRLLGTILDITESKSDELRKNDFIAMASHELKTPLTSIKAYIQLLSKKMAGSDDEFTTNTLLKVGKQINKMTDLIHGFLDLSKIEPGKLKLKVTEFNMNKLIEHTITEVRHLSHNHLINFGQLDKIMVRADKEKISQVISNFLGNAVKYSDKGTSITVKSEIKGEFVQVSVTDEGIGIKPKDQQKLFQRFYRVNNEKLKNVSGFGIGLYLASEIIQHHHGEIGVESDGHNGSTFYFRIPAK